MTEDLVAYLKADATLTGLIGSGDNCRLYPDVATKDPTAPFVVYRIQSDQGRTKSNVVQERMYGFSVFAETLLAAETIGRRLEVLLDKDESIDITSDNYFIKSSWLVSGSSMYEQETAVYHRAVLFTVLFLKK